MAKTDFDSAFANVEYGYADFKKDVLSWLFTKYGSAVHPGNKALYVAGNGNRRDADVLPCVSFRKYRKFNSMNDQDYVEGICFFFPDGTRIINYPRQHSDNLTWKHQQTGGWLKPAVRILKNMRNRMVNDGVIEEGLAPSYYLEGMLYNVPTDLFGTTYAHTLTHALAWLAKTDRSKLVCANEQYYLLWKDTRTSWDPDKCELFLDRVLDFWNNW
ncbi:hypothetical protein SAMCFNEI73_pA0133 (plasmid) [Sinorhizobium americanum]|uniref:cGAS/DncV-like nucleotidyltransferase C-terminal helical domain-containing protein n=2 Tax=Sinorhizobium americanum TaxID=194963 RepID=A0A1L3LSP6_9HYPH|nr:hypothetical protein SAMCFNEI73_pA0133 [Sinorhizobium americanum]